MLQCCVHQIYPSKANGKKPNKTDDRESRAPSYGHLTLSWWCFLYCSCVCVCVCVCVFYLITGGVIPLRKEKTVITCCSKGLSTVPILSAPRELFLKCKVSTSHFLMVCCWVFSFFLDQNVPYIQRQACSKTPEKLCYRFASILLAFLYDNNYTPSMVRVMASRALTC